MREDWLTRMGGGGGGAVPGNQDHIMRPATVYKTGENLHAISSLEIIIFLLPSTFTKIESICTCSWKHCFIRGGGI
jgi:hypothetical protein